MSLLQARMTYKRTECMVFMWTSNACDTVLQVLQGDPSQHTITRCNATVLTMHGVYTANANTR
jgi:hypothetical protein